MDKVYNGSEFVCLRRWPKSQVEIHLHDQQQALANAIEMNARKNRWDIEELFSF